jgi:hypothetical protein
MPVAKSFSTLGYGNGFTFCASKVDVTNYLGGGVEADKWTTLSGWSKDNEPATPELKAASIAGSRQRAMRIFWNLNGVSGTVETSSGSNPDFSFTETIDMDAGGYTYIQWFQEGGPSVTGVNKKPNERVCYYNYTSFAGDELGDGLIEIKIGIVRMYKGVTTDEDNFIGYGIFPNFFGSIALDHGGYEFLSLDSVSETPYGISEYVEYSGAFFVAVMESSNPQGDPGVGYSISVDGSGNVVGVYTEDAPANYISTMTMEPLDFYTYPA